MRKVLCWLLLCMLLVSGASAEIAFVPQTAEWDLTLPVEITLSADVKTHMPFDDERCAQLNALLRHVSLRLGTSADENAAYRRLAVLVDGDEALRVLQKETSDAAQVQLSWLPGETITGGAEVLNELLGQETAQGDLYGFSGEETRWLDDGAMLMNSIGDALQAYGKEAAIRTSVKNMGLARKKITYTVPKKETDQFAKAVADRCPEGSLKEFLKGLVWSGQQKLILWLTGEGAVIRAEYAGRCGVDEDHMRQVSLKWRLRRGDQIRDELTLKTPAVRGSDYNTVTLSRKMVQEKKKTVSYVLDFSENIRAEKKKSTRTAEIELSSQEKKGISQVSGSVTLKQQLPGDETKYAMTLQPEISIGCDGGTPVVTGKVNVQQLRGKAVLEDVDIRIDAGAGTFVEWQDMDSVRPLASMDAQQRSTLMEAMASALVPHLVLLPQEDTLYLSADMSEEVWQQIVEAARSVLPEEENQ